MRHLRRKLGDQNDAPAHQIERARLTERCEPYPHLSVITRSDDSKDDIGDGDRGAKYKKRQLSLKKSCDRKCDRSDDGTFQRNAVHEEQKHQIDTCSDDEHGGKWRQRQNEAQALDAERDCQKKRALRCDTGIGYGCLSSLSGYAPIVLPSADMPITVTCPSRSIMSTFPSSVGTTDTSPQGGS